MPCRFITIMAMRRLEGIEIPVTNVGRTLNRNARMTRMARAAPSATSRPSELMESSISGAWLEISVNWISAGSPVLMSSNSSRTALTTSTVLASALLTKSIVRLGNPFVRLMTPAAPALTGMSALSTPSTARRRGKTSLSTSSCKSGGGRSPSTDICSTGNCSKLRRLTRGAATDGGNWSRSISARTAASIAGVSAPNSNSAKATDRLSEEVEVTVRTSSCCSRTSSMGIVTSFRTVSGSACG